MKLDTAVIVTKCACSVAIGAGAAFTTGIAQWFNTGDWPPRIAWIGILVGAATAGASNLYSFLSGSFTNYKRERDEQSKQP